MSSSAGTWARTASTVRASSSPRTETVMFRPVTSRGWPMSPSARTEAPNAFASKNTGNGRPSIIRLTDPKRPVASKGAPL